MRIPRKVGGALKPKHNRSADKGELPRELLVVLLAFVDTPRYSAMTERAGGRVNSWMLYQPKAQTLGTRIRRNPEFLATTPGPQARNPKPKHARVIGGS